MWVMDWIGKTEMRRCLEKGGTMIKNWSYNFVLGIGFKKMLKKGGYVKRWVKGKNIALEEDESQVIHSELASQTNSVRVVFCQQPL